MEKRRKNSSDKVIIAEGFLAVLRASTFKVLLLCFAVFYLIFAFLTSKGYGALFAFFCAFAGLLIVMAYIGEKTIVTGELISRKQLIFFRKKILLKEITSVTVKDIPIPSMIFRYSVVIKTNKLHHFNFISLENKELFISALRQKKVVF